MVSVAIYGDLRLIADEHGGKPKQKGPAEDGTIISEGGPIGYHENLIDTWVAQIHFSVKLQGSLSLLMSLVFSSIVILFSHSTCIKKKFMSDKKGSGRSIIPETKQNKKRERLAVALHIFAMGINSCSKTRNYGVTLQYIHSCMKYITYKALVFV